MPKKKVTVNDLETAIEDLARIFKEGFERMNKHFDCIDKHLDVLERGQKDIILKLDFKGGLKKENLIKSGEI